MNNNFSFKRFAIYSVAEVGVQQRRFWLDMLVMSSIMIFVYLLFCSNWGGSNFYKSINLRFELARSIVLLVLATFSLIYICRSFVIFHKPLSANFALTVPASKLEKFVFAAFFYSVGVSIFLSLIDYLLFAVFSNAFSIVDASYIPKLIGDRAEIYTASNISSSLAISCFFFFCAVFFRRRQLLYLLLSSTVLWIVTVVGMVVVVVIYGNDDYAQLFKLMDPVMTYLVCPVIGIGLILLTWYKFKKIQKK